MVVSRSPQAPERVLIDVPNTDQSAVTTAIERSRKAAREWWQGGAPARAQALAAAADKFAAASEEITSLVVDEVGKPLTEARAEVGRGVAILRYFAQQALEPDGEVLPAANPRVLLHTRRRPHGVVGLITPWNFPVAIPLWKAAPALAFGNAVVLKPASDATAIGSRIGELVASALPDGLLQVLPGSGGTGQAIIDNCDCLSFTGSVEVGKSLAVEAAKRGIPVQAEMGGLNASIVLPDADLTSASASIAYAAMGYAGQKCTATGRVVVVGNESRQAETRDALIAAIENQRIGDPADEATTVGPVIGESPRDDVVSAAEGAKAAGARILTGGRRVDRSGWFVEPTVVDQVGLDSQVATQEVFGPICAVLPARDPAHAVELNNAVRYGLVTSIYTRDLDVALEALGEIDTGMVRVNQPTSGVDFWAPFGGEKESSYGPREQGKAARDFYTTTHTLTVGPGS